MAGEVDVDAMLERIPISLFNEWKMYDDLEPFGEERDDYRFASIVHALWNIARDQRKAPDGWPLDDFLLGFGDRVLKQKAPVVQSIETQTLLLDAWIGGSNAVFEKLAKEGR